MPAATREQRPSNDARPAQPALRHYLFQADDDDSGGETAKPLAVFPAAARLTVIGSEAQVQAAIESGGQQTHRAKLDFLNPDSQLLFVFVPRDKSAFIGAIPPAVRRIRRAKWRGWR